MYSSSWPTYWKSIDTMLMGRKTWAVAVAQGRRWWRRRRRHHDVRLLPHARVGRGTVRTSLGEDAGEFVRELKEQPGKGICVMGGGELAQSLLAAGVVDEVGLNVHPILLGSGVPLFRDGGRRISARACRVASDRWRVRAVHVPRSRQCQRTFTRRKSAKRKALGYPLARKWLIAE